MRALPYLVFGVFATASVVLYISGCALSKNWYPMFTLFPAIVCCFFLYGFLRSIEDNYEQEGCFSFTSDSSLFLLVFSIVSAVMLPITFYRCSTIDLKSLLMHLGGDISVAIGFSLYMYLAKREEYDQI